MKRVVVGLSGGVDSSVAAYLLKEQGYEVIGMFMKNWHDDSVTISDECPWMDDSHDALIVAEKLGIPFQTIDFSEEYKQRIVDYMFAEYKAGRTPNPDVLCNREIKFDIFLEKAMKLNADFVATGHYCQKGEIQVEGSTVYQLKAGADPNKDQSYFLCQLTQNQLSKALFPIGHLQKPEVRAIAKEQGLVTAEKKDSQGLCFIGKVKLPTFLQQQLAVKKGSISKTDGEVVGSHDGAHFFTIGQRKGLRVGGKPEPLFVIATDVKENIIYVGMGEEHPGLNRKALKVLPDDIHWVRLDRILASGESLEVQARIRYRQPLQKATLHQTEDGLFITFDEFQRGMAPGQFAAWYEGEELLGSGVIHE
ncbi:UNVERIFIED_CONTAM: hypothetical protein GTU68_054451 [Idotea baltica]|nr:hypothetical protein [Idotea baltica]